MSGLELNPREVLDHLYELGYANITPAQLREFVKDLKKLIKFDQRAKEDVRKKFCDNDSLEKEKEDQRPRPAAACPKPCRTVSPVTAQLAESNMRRPRPDFNLQFDKDETATSKGTSVSCTNSDVIDSRQKASRTRSETRGEKPKSERLNPSRPCSAKENVPPTKSSSFIRPWKYQAGAQRPGSLSHRCDPVALYHKYQSLWQQNKIPGEESHSNLRWNIREKMLGQDPQPRPISQASSLESMSRKRVTRM